MQSYYTALYKGHESPSWIVQAKVYSGDGVFIHQNSDACVNRITQTSNVSLEGVDMEEILAMLYECNLVID
jgi:hypothetical protein